MLSMSLLNVSYSLRSELSRSPCQYFSFVSHSKPFLAVLFGVGSLFYYPPTSVFYRFSSRCSFLLPRSVVFSFSLGFFTVLRSQGCVC